MATTSVLTCPHCHISFRGTFEPLESDPSRPKSVSDFLDAGISRSVGARMKTSTMMNAYREWCREASIRPISAQSFGRVISDLGVRTYRSNGIRYYLDVQQA